VAPRYPLLLDLAGRPCLVVGGGEVATRKVLALLAAEAVVTVEAPALAAPLAELVSTGRLWWRASTYLALGTADGGRPWRLVVAATDDPALNARVAGDAERAGIWANDASSATGGAAAVPASWRDGPLTLAVSTAGVHPAAARWLADELGASRGHEVARALELLEDVRLAEVAAGGPGRRPDWRCAVDSGMLEAIRAGQLAEAKERLEACLSSSSD
jgi:siroheme synthase-like protein